MTEIVPISFHTEAKIAEFDTALIQKLQAFYPKFLGMRQELIRGSDLSVGFGSLPKAHEGSFGVGTRLSTHGGEMFYQGPSPFGLQIEYPLIRDEAWRIIDQPDIFHKHPFVVSLYAKTDSHMQPTYVDTAILTAPDDILEGIVAHELTELRMKFGSSLPPSIMGKLEHIRLVLDKIDAAGILPGTKKEVEFDLAASLLGYRDFILASRKFNIERLTVYNQMTPGNFYDRHILQQRYHLNAVSQLTK